MSFLEHVLTAIKCMLRRKRIKRAIRQKGGKIGTNVKITVGDDAGFSFGNSLRLNSSGITACKRMQIVVVGSGFLSMGDCVGISTSSIFCGKEISIGSHVKIGAECLLIDSDFHSTNWEDRIDRRRDVQNAKSAPIRIGDHVFIGARSIVLKGVTIGQKSVIMAGSVVSKDIPENCIAGGNPCRVLKQI